MVKAERFLESSEMAKELQTSMDSATRLRIAVAFINDGGYSEIRDRLEQNLKKGKEVEFIVGACPDYRLTDASVLKELKGLESKYRSLKLRVFDKGYFHPKLFIFERGDTVRIVVGSSNLTSAGITDNIEANVLLERDRKEGIIDKILRFFDNEILALSSPLTDEWIDAYRDYCENIENKTGSVKRPVIRRPDQIGSRRRKTKETAREVDMDYPSKKRKLSENEKEEIRQWIKAIKSEDWEPKFCIDLAKKHRCSSWQIRGFKARVHHAKSWR